MASKYLSSGVCAAFTLRVLGNLAHTQSTGSPEASVLAPESFKVQPPAQADYEKILNSISVTATRIPIKSFGFIPGDVLVIPGIRHDDYKTSSSPADDNDESEVAPRVGASCLPTNWLVSFANYASAVRAPAFDESFLTGDQHPLRLGPQS